jgi:succinylarginine dihydrolase
MVRVYEVNMDGLVGPTHHYAGLASGNLASMEHALTTSNPRIAAKQGLKKMRDLHQLGLQQALLPPHQRPNFHLLHQLGFTGTPDAQIAKAWRLAPELLSAASSASSMWAANTATVTPSRDSLDNKVHFTAANLMSHLHRHQEAFFSQQLLQQIFSNEAYFQHHDRLPSTIMTSDEGAANHSRLCAQHNQSGLHLFVYGKRGLITKGANNSPIKYPARQSFEASSAIARAHLLPPESVVFACQNPLAIDEGVFHNDVIAVANESVLLVHEQAFHHQQEVLDALQRQADFPITIIEISKLQLPITDAVNSYLFNSQLVSLPDGSMMLVAPIECVEHLQVKCVIDDIIADKKNPITKVLYVDLRQSMHNGGGPACLRLRVVLNDQELQAMHQGVILTDDLFETLDHWIDQFYRSELTIKDLASKDFINQSLEALDSLTSILKLGSIYPFQQEIPPICTGKR